MKQFDIIVIGTGTAGQTAAFDLAAEGYRVAVAENSPTPGGVCALRGCQAKKWFYETMEVVARSRHLLGKGITEPPRISWKQIQTQKNAFTSKIPESTIAGLKGSDITYITGQAQFIDPKTLRIGTSEYTTRYVIIAAGAFPMSLPIEGAGHMITSDDFLDLTSLPRRIAFIGGGFISFEFAHFAARLGSGDVHILEAADRPLGPFDKDMVAQLVNASENDGIQVHAGVSITSVVKNGSGYTIHFTSGQPLVVDLVVNGAGRIPNIEPLHLDAAGVTASKKGIPVDPAMRTSIPTIFAVGDCVQTVMLARVADMEAHVAAKSIMAMENGTDLPAMDYTAVPAVLFTYPQLAMVGKTEEMLEKEKIKYWKSHDTGLGWPTYRRIGMEHAAYKVLVGENDCILGAHFLGDNTTGLINAFKQAMIDKTPITRLRDDHIMAPYPSRESDILYMLDPLID
ncbi:MAG: NAD(P)/FAD-dependent oxidoreductase [Desulfotignum sp.]|jgi:glutathione reductase (NADPH)|nr:NAD(P)/FAD-dependent oxidoreductase [Desulfotignum sp.]